MILGLGLTLWPNRGPAGAGGGGGGGGGASYRYWRIFMLNSNSGTFMALNEVELRGSVGGVDITTPATPVTASTLFSSAYGPQYTVDNLLGEAPLWISTISSVTNQWLCYDLGTPTAIAQVAMCWNATIHTGPNTGPKDLRIEGSNDGTSFTTVKTFLGNTSWPAGAFKVFDL